MIDKYQQYLKNIHASFEFPKEMLEKVVQEATGRKPVVSQRITAGEVNEVYDATLPSNEHVIVRVSRHEDSDFTREEWAISKVKELGVAVPEILLITSVVIENETISVCVQKKLEGEPLERGSINYQKLDKSTLHNYMQQAGAILSNIHSVKVEGFDYLNNQGKGYVATFKELMTHHLGNKEEFLHITHDKTERKTLEKVFNVLEQKTLDMKEIQPLLSHNDFGPKHIMVKDGKITGILDWGAASGHSPVNDFAGLALWYPEIPLEWIKEGYGNKELFDDNFEGMLHLIILNNALGAFWWYHEQKYESGMGELVAKIKNTVQFLEL